MIKKYILLFIIGVFFTLKADLKKEKNYIVSGCYNGSIGDSFPGTIFIFDPENNQLVYSFNSYEKSTVYSAAYFENNGEMQILTRLANKTIVIQKLDGSIFRKFELQPEDLQDEFSSEIDSNLLLPSSVALVRDVDDSLQILVGYRCGKIAVWDVNSGKHRFFIGNQSQKNSYGVTAFSLFFDHSIAHVAAASCDGSVCVYNFHTGEKLKTFTGFKSWVSSVAVFKDQTGFNIVAGSLDKTIRCWNYEDQELRYIIDNLLYYKGPNFGIKDPRHSQMSAIYGLNLFKMSNTEIAIAPIAINDNNVLFDAQTGDCIKILEGQTSSSTDIRVYNGSSQGIKLVSVCDGFVNLWDVDSGGLEHSFKTEILGRNICLFFQNNSMFCAVSFGNIQNVELGCIGFFNLETEENKILNYNSAWMNAVASFDQKFQDLAFVAVSPDYTIGSYIGMYDLTNIQVINVSSNEQ